MGKSKTASHQRHKTIGYWSTRNAGFNNSPFRTYYDFEDRSLNSSNANTIKTAGDDLCKTKGSID